MKVSWIFPFLILILLIIPLFILYFSQDIIIIRDGKRVENLTMIQRLQFEGNPNLLGGPENIVFCYSKYKGEKNQSFFNDMYNCLNISVAKIEYTIIKSDITRAILDAECDCLTNRSAGCVKYGCSNQIVKIRKI